MNRIEFQSMGSHMLAVLDSSSETGRDALLEVPAWFEKWEQSLSRFRPDSELSQLNRSSGNPVAVSETLWEVFHAARQAEQDTFGLVRPTMLDALVQAGYDHPFDSLLPHSIKEAEMSLKTSGLAADVAWDTATHSLCLPEALHLDFGGVAKGWAAGKVVQQLKCYGPTLVDAGGDIAISGLQSDGQPWPIGVRDPFQPDTSFATLLLKFGAVATSGTDYHHWKQGKIWNHHIIDPRTGLPAITDLLTVSVIAPDAIRAEAAAKAILIMGSSAGMDWLEAEPELAGLMILQFGEVRYSQRIADYLWREKCLTTDLMNKITNLH